ncbi:MAG TPA: GNAT family N-acetyltransferase, partial [Minicystis sp.]|nr:GNAT family N-acetyltransferase [Minicystis sp.]
MSGPPAPAVVRPMEAGDLPTVDRVFRLAFGTYLGMPDPSRFAGDSDLVGTRFEADPGGAIVAEMDGEVVGSCFATCWGALGFFGPLTVRPDLWDRGIAHALLAETNALFDRRGVRVRGLYTFAQSAKHVRLYQRFGYWPRFLNATLSGPVSPSGADFETLPSAPGADALAEVRAVADALFPGLDPSREIASVAAQELGDTVLVRRATGELEGYAIV